MPYSDFTLKKVKENFGISVVEDQELYSSVAAVGISAYLTETLKYNVPLALAVGTEKILIKAKYFFTAIRPDCEFTINGNLKLRETCTDS
jgi:hypothetical protein